MDYHPRAVPHMHDRGRPMDLGDPRTPMAWQHRDSNYHHRRSEESEAFDENFEDYKMRNGASRYRGPPTPSSAHSRHTRASEGNQRRRDTRGSSSER